MDEDEPPEASTASPKPLMMDEGVQTIGLDAIPTPVSNESTEPVMTPAPIPATKEASPVPPEPQPIQPELSQQDVQDRLEPDAQREASHADHAPFESMPTNHTQPDILPTNQEHTEPISAHQGVPTTLFGTPKPVNPFSMFGTAAPTRMEPGSNLADQVRFGFSHIPQTPHDPTLPSDHGMSGFDDHASAPYPEAFLSPSGPAQYANMDPYADLPEQNQEGDSVHDTHMLMEPPAAGNLDRAEWEVPAEPHYDSLDGLRFAPAALEGDTEFLAEQHACPFIDGSPTKVPEGFSSYGNPAHAPSLSSEDEEASSPSSRPPVRHNDFVQNDETFDASQEAVAVDDEDDSIATDSNGEELEEGDYDQRQYVAPEDDEEGIPEELNEAYDEDAVYDEDDADGESWDGEEGEEEDYESESADEDVETTNVPAQPTRKPAPSSSAPVFIDLISDSEEDDEPTPVPARRAPSPKIQQASTPSQPPKPRPDLIDPMLARAAAMAQDEVDKQALDSAQYSNEGQDRIQVVDFAHTPAATRDEGVQESVEDVDSSAEDTKPLPRGSHARSESVDRERSLPTSEPHVDDGESSKDGLFVKQPRGQAFMEEDAVESGDAHSSDDDSDAGSAEDETNDQDLDADADMDGVDTDDQSDNDIESGGDVEIGDASEAEAEEEDDEEEAEEGVEEEEEAASPTFPDDAMEIDEEPAEEEPVDEEPVDEEPADEDSVEEELAAGDEVIREAEQLEQQLLGEMDDHSASESALATVSTQQQRSNGGAATDASNGDLEIEADNEPATRTSVEEDEEPEGKATESGASTPVQQDMVVEEVTVEEEVTIEETFIVEQQKLLDPSASFEQIVGGASSRTLAETEPSFQFSTQENRASSPVESVEDEPPAELKATPTRLTRSMRHRNVDTDDSVASQSQAHLDADETQVDNDTKAPGTPTSVGMDRSSRHEIDGQASPSQETRATRKKRAAASALPKSDDTRDDAEEQMAQQISRRTRSSNAPPSPSVAVPSSPDISVQLARQSVAAKRSKKAAPEPLRSSPRMTRARSSSLQTSPHSPEFEDNSVRLARAALASPSRSKQTPEPEAETASLKADLTKHLRSFRECISLKSLRTHVDEHPNVLAVVTSTPAEPVRAKGGPREYVMSFTVTDPSMAPTHVVEVQLYRPHKESLPVVQPGDAILLQKFQVKALSNKGFGLRSHTESAWAVFDVDDGPPQIKGPPIEDYDQYGDHMMTLRAWYASLDEAALGKLEKASKKFEEAGMGK